MPGKGLFLSISVLVLIAGFFSGSFFASVSGDKPAGLAENQAISLTDRDYFPTVHHLFNSSNVSIHMVMFSMNYYPDYPDSLANYLIEDLMEASERGIDVKIITDQFDTEKPVLSMLSETGINIKYDSKDTTTHGKLIIIDSKIVIVGSTNWSYYSIEKNHEANLIINSEEIAKQFEDYFEKIWREA